MHKHKPLIRAIISLKSLFLLPGVIFLKTYNVFYDNSQVIILTALEPNHSMPIIEIDT